MGDVDDAACNGADPRLFDVFTYPEALPALAYCAMCFVHDACLEVVRPQRSHFDGVAGKVVWRNGYRVRSNNTTREDRFIRLREQGEIT